MTLRAVPLVAGIARLPLTSVEGAVVVGQDADEDEVSTDATTTTSFPPSEEPTTTSVVDPNATRVIEVPAAPVSLGSRAAQPWATAGSSVLLELTGAPA